MLKNRQNALKKYTENPVAMLYHTETINQRFSAYAYWIHAGVVRSQTCNTMLYLLLALTLGVFLRITHLEVRMIALV